MSYNASEQATLNFYQWEYRHRGYYHFDTPVDLEVPYVPFTHKSNTQNKRIDDGKVLSLFKSISNFILPTKNQEKEEELTPIQPRVLGASNLPNTVGFSITFPNKQEILPQRNIEFLNMLSFSEHSISFEIIANTTEIKIQMVSSEQDKQRIASHLKAYFPTAILQEQYINDFGFDIHENIAIADFGMNDEFMRPIAMSESFAIDPLTSIVATMDSLQANDIAVFQILFKGITSPLANDITYSVSDGTGGSFFDDAPEMLHCAKDKIANPLFTVVMRIATQGESNIRSQYLAQELARSISAVSSSHFNKLIPLSNEGYNYDFHFYNLHNRLSNRLGFILNSKELNSFLHYPNKSVVSKKLGTSGNKTKAYNPENQNGILLGQNNHYGFSKAVHLDTQTRLSHCHIIGVTGVGKSTLIANMMLADIDMGLGCALFDPHGDIIDDILLRIPEHRKNDVILIDPSDTDFPVGFNLLEANTEAEKIVLSSDLVAAFKRHATAWGDNMTAVLQNAVNTILESENGGTLIELKRFLIEDTFRTNYLASVDDPSLHYYWQHEYLMLSKRIAPLLTRIDTFLRPKLVRYMLAQKKGVTISDVLNTNKIILLKLSQGLIGEYNSYLLGSLFLAKFNQAALARQSKSKGERKPYMLYLDEFQNFITPSIERILSGARKYSLGLTIAHQELGQIEDNKLLNSVLSNPKTRICFRLGDSDAKRLESGFSYFEHSDLQSLNVGQAIMRIGSSQNDFNLQTFPFTEVKPSANTIKEYIVERTRNSYAKPRKKVEAILLNLLPKGKLPTSKKTSKEAIEKEHNLSEKLANEPISNPVNSQIAKEDKLAETIENTTPFETQKQEYLDSQIEKERSRKHENLQNYVKAISEQQGFKSVIEETLDNDTRVDVGLTKDKVRIAVEISVTNSSEYELQNIQKCIDANYDRIIMISDNNTHLANIESKALNSIPKKYHSKIHFISSNAFAEKLNRLAPQKKIVEKRVKGYRVKTSYNQKPMESLKKDSLGQIILKSLRKNK